MGEKLVIGPINKGFRNDRTAFVIDNDAFPVLRNSYQWRGRVKRKRGTGPLTRLIQSFDSGDTTITLSSGIGNIITGFSIFPSSSSIVAGSAVIEDTVSAKTYTDDGQGNLIYNSAIGGSIRYNTGEIGVLGGGSHTVTASFDYYPNLPVMGLEDFYNTTTGYIDSVAFDTTYSYSIPITYPYASYNISFYKNPVTGSYTGYTAKGDPTPVTWNGQDYQQFWTTNYQGAMWTTNGITVPFTTTNIGMQFKPIATITYASATTVTITITESSESLVIGDFVFINEVSGTDNYTVNFQTGYVTAISNNGTTTTMTVKLPNATVANQTYTGGILQYLTNVADSTLDCIRWYDGDPTQSESSMGWVNFMPPLSQASYGIGGLTLAQYYLVGAVLILPFKDRLIFFGPVVQTSTGDPIYLQDTIVYSQNGTPYYTASFAASSSSSIVSAATTFNPILTPTNQSATPNSYFADVTGFGGFQTVGVDQPITTVSPNEDVLIVGFQGSLQTRMVYSGNDIVPFNFFIVNSELGSSSTFSVINMDKGVLTRGSRGFIITNQTGSQRIDLEIPDEVFQMQLLSNGAQRVTAQRDFINEWVYFSYANNNSYNVFPNQTLQFNYRDNSYGVFLESYTTYGQFRKQSGVTWATLPSDLTWATWNTPWNAGDITLLQPDVIGGNQQGFVIIRDTGVTTETPSLYISDISTNTITSPDHCLNTGDYIIINGCTGEVADQVNGKVFSVALPTDDTFQLNPPITSSTYFGNGTITRMYVPFIQTKQFPTSWELSRKTRLGPQQYLFTYTDRGQITLLIFLSQDSSTAWNDSPIVPSAEVTNDSLIYSTLLYTCPESTNIGLTDITYNLNTPTAKSQQQIWHRMNTSLIGDTVQIGFTLNDSQMRDLDDLGQPISQFLEIELHSIILDVQPSQLLC